VLLVRGEETILISPNSVIGMPAAPKDGLSTTIIQQAGEILLEVEKRNVKHFEIETPFFAAVVKGTQFRVSVDKSRRAARPGRGGGTSSPANTPWCCPDRWRRSCRAAWAASC
jgi:FecR protein